MSIVVLEGSEITTERQMHDALSKQLDFGTYYGNNLNALWDMLKGQVEMEAIIWENSEYSRAEIGPELFDTIVGLFRKYQEYRREWNESPFKLELR